MIEKLKSKFECIENASLLNYNTYRLDTKCKLLVFPRDIFEFQEIMYILNGKVSGITKKDRNTKK